ncbi:MAG: GNAT family N-acetyltransferase [Nocardiopsaceae bacterium]|nr:GNAT family N-acetyltransferase [Nocardiopsaceae bacterium]
MDVTIGPPGPADTEEFVAAARASRALHRPWLFPPDTPETFAEYLDRAAREDYAAYLIRDTGSGRLVGFVNVTQIVRGALQSAFAGYGAFAGHEGRGLMTQGLAAVLGEAFGSLRLHRVEASIQPGNARSIALVQRLGFEKEGFSPRYLLVDGAWRDHERWAIRAETWYAAGGGARWS